MMRLDLFLLHNRLASSRTQAQEFIVNGFVYLLQNSKKTQLKKPSFEIDEDLHGKVIVEDNHLQKYVSRAGLKLEAALKTLNINVSNQVVLDVGQSTGGFSDCLIQSGARCVLGLDVGHGQLHRSLINHAQIISIEGLNAKDLKSNTSFLAQVPANKFDMIVMDVSFISLIKVIPFVVEFLRPGGEYLFLVKPQFECGQEHLDKNGIVKNSSVYAEIETSTRKKVFEYFNNVEAYIKSDLIGKDGNQEYFIYGKNSI